MGFLDFFFQTDINAGLAQYQADPKGVLLDVRTRGGVHPRPSFPAVKICPCRR